VHEGVDVDGNLTCTADATNGVEQMTIACTGTSTDGRDLRLDGTVTSVEQGERGGIQGTFTGTAGEETVFTTDCLGVGC
jgi:hypothetical protein